MNSDLSSIDVQVASVAERAGAFALLLCAVPEAERFAQVAALLAEVSRQPDACNGLLVARQRGAVVGAIWLQLLAGGGANVWPPRATETAPAGTLGALVSAAVERARAAKCAILQVLLPNAEQPLAALFASAGFAHVADLIYLVALPNAAANAPSQSPISFESVTTAGVTRLERVLEQTYAGSLDCPALNGRRTPAEVLDEYRHIGVFDPARWLLVQQAGRDIGCLILNAHADRTTWELVYMGLVPSARGHGFGQLVVGQARQLAAAAGARKILLAVDRQNQPAVAMYEACGFVGWDERAAWVRFLD
ncbi:MAG: GNAT family N-acetyltransferase [Planctomycetes bacterium]|nr:GNAT family N-acetyltransferase [Planctomycetota bacterium]